MIYIGTSLGACLRDILAGKVSVDEVLFINARTNAPTYDKFIHVVEQYYELGNPYTKNPDDYELSDYDWDRVKELADVLWNSGRIHQPRVFTEQEYGLPNTTNTLLSSHGLWMHVSPMNRNTTPAVVEAWEKYKFLDNLTNG